MVAGGIGALYKKHGAVRKYVENINAFQKMHHPGSYIISANQSSNWTSTKVVTRRLKDNKVTVLG